MGDADPCPSCGARLGGRAGCQAAFDDLSARAWSTPARGAVHNLVVDAYATQHAEEFGRSAKSYAAHSVAGRHYRLSALARTDRLALS